MGKKNNQAGSSNPNNHQQQPEPNMMNQQYTTNGEDNERFQPVMYAYNQDPTDYLPYPNTPMYVDDDNAPTCIVM